MLLFALQNVTLLKAVHFSHIYDTSQDIRFLCLPFADQNQFTLYVYIKGLVCTSQRTRIGKCCIGKQSLFPKGLVYSTQINCAEKIPTITTRQGTPICS